MDFNGIQVGYILTGSFCTFSKSIPKIKEIKSKGAEILPIMSFNAYNLDTKFGNAKEYINIIKEITQKDLEY